MMRKLLIALATLTAASTLTGSASAAKPVTTVRAHTLGVVPRVQPSVTFYGDSWVAKADAHTIAWGSLAPGASATTVNDAGTVRALPAQPGCTALTAGGGNVGYDCSPKHDERTPSTTLTTRVVSLAGAVVGTTSAVVPVPALVPPAPNGLFGATFRLDGLGTRWAHYSQNCDFKYCARSFYSQDVDWHTGQARAIKTLDPGLRESLDAAALTVPLCTPLRSNMAAAVTNGTTAVLPVVLDRPWAILAGAPDADGQPTWTLRRCGSSRAVKLPAGYVPVTLGGGWVLLETTRSANGAVRLLRLADGRLVTIAGVRRSWSPDASTQAAVTGGRVVLTTGNADGSRTVSTARLPRR